MDIPNARSSHKMPTPRAGGVAIVVTFIIGIMVIFMLADKAQIHQEYFWGFLLSAMLIALISFYDDLKAYTFKIKLITHLVAIVVVLVTGIVLDQLALPLVGNVVLGWVGYAITFVWLLGLTNAYNFMDGVDGMAALTAIIACSFFAWISFHLGSYFVYILSYTILAGAAGFLFWNWSPAKIFMGDTGSAFLGFVFACMAIIAARYDVSHTTFLVIPMLLFHFIFDTTFTLSRRAMAGENVTQAHRTHLYQLLVRMGLTHARVTLLYGLMAIIQGFAAVWMVQSPGELRLWFFVPFIVLYFVLARRIVRQAREYQLLG